MSTAQPPTMLAAVHVPKTAGTTFREALQRVFGDDLRLDYDDRPLAHSRWDRRTTALRHAITSAGKQGVARCVYGHYLPVKYATTRQVRFCVWLRDPVQRVVSRYQHYLRRVQHEAHHARWGLVPGLSLEQFARLPHYQNTYAEYFWLFPLRRFDFIGIVEDYDAELDRFAMRFGIEARLLAGVDHNRNPDKTHASYQVDASDERMIRACNARDVELYARAREQATRQTAQIA